MKEWQGNIIGAIVITIIGIGLILWANMIELPTRYRTFLGIPYAVNPEFVIVSYQVVTLLFFGVLLLGFGLGILANTYSIYRLEKKLGRPPQPMTRFCPQCGSAVTEGARFCYKCGKQLET